MSVIPQWAETNLVGYLDRKTTSTDTTIYVHFYDKVSGDARVPLATTKMFVIDKGQTNRPSDKYEIIICASHSTTSDLTTLTTVTRGLAFNGTSLAAVTANAKEHSANAEIGCVDVHYLNTILASILDGTNSGTGLKLGYTPTFEASGILADRVFADATARDAAITAPSNGMSVYLTDTGKFYDYTAGSWVARESGGTFANASTTAAGKVEVATQSENNAGTSTGGTGASLIATPALNAVSVQNSVWTYAVDAGGDDTYAITLTPAPTAYVAGQMFNVRFTSANSGAATLNVNGLGAILIYKYRNGLEIPLETGDIIADMDLLLQYTADNVFVVLSQLATNVADTPTASIVAGEAIDGSTTPQAVCVVGNSQYIDFVGATNFNFPTGDGASAFGYDDGNTRVAVKFTTPTTGGILGETITLPYLYLSLETAGSPTDNVYIEIMTNSGSNLPSGTIVTNGTSSNVAYTSIGADEHAVRFTFATPPTLTSNTTYWATVRRSTTNNSTNYYQAQYTTAASGTGAVYTASAGTWAATTQQLRMMLHYSLDGQGRLFKADANDLNRCNFVGFTSSNVVAGESASVQCESILTYSGLTAGKKYYLSDTAGAITNAFTGSATYPTIPVGKSLSTTKLTIDNSPRKICASDLGSIKMIQASGTAISNLDVYLPVRFGFIPSKLTVFWQTPDSDASSSSSGFKVFNLTSPLSGYNLIGLENNYTVVLFSSHAATAAKQTETYFGYGEFKGYIDSVFDNGVIFRLRWENNTVNVPLISVIAEE